jgi:hypothetical protein
MRTTVTLDPDVERLVRDRMKQQGVSFKEALNASIRSGAHPKVRPARRFVQKTFSLGSEQNFRWDKALAIAEAIEDEELGRKLSLRK